MLEVESACLQSEKKILPQANTDLQLSTRYHQDDMSKVKVVAQQISGCLAENSEESGQDDRKGCDEVSSSLVPEHIAKKESANSSELWYSTVSHDVKHEISAIDSNSKTEYALISVPERKANVTSPEEHSEYDDVLVT
ncbi:hypothetical protein DV515_00006531 [Chloebia gouldiae]|uniref:Uncharacterized protein n=1 Tax=Chloebia gouldiae TaxID=44316 RepID=A0A3L8SJQ2_CHLGU|nr:hypothetical protein DV515_00006531 [Chloebia gouldiae]